MATVKTLAYHTSGADVHDVGDTYDVDESAVDNLVGQGLVVRVDEPGAVPKTSTAVEPMTTENSFKPQ